MSVHIVVIVVVLVSISLAQILLGSRVQVRTLRRERRR